MNLRYDIFVLIALIVLIGGFSCNSDRAIPEIGVIAPIENDSFLFVSGYTLIGETVGKMISPRLSEGDFSNRIAEIKNARTRLYLCNVLFPSDIKIVGPDVDEARVLKYLDSVFIRANEAEVPLIVLGSGGARRVPNGYDYDLAKSEFIGLSKKMAEVAKNHDILIAIESLNSSETNFINTLEEATEIVRKVDHPNFKLNADIYHMMKEAESPQHIIEAGDIIVHVEIAEKEDRTVPGVKGDNFVPYFRALKEINYTGPIFIEARIGDLKSELPEARKYLEAQLETAYN